MLFLVVESDKISLLTMTQPMLDFTFCAGRYREQSEGRCHEFEELGETGEEEVYETSLHD